MDVARIAGAVEHDHAVAAFKRSGIRKHPGRLALGRGEERVGKVIAKVCIQLAELLRLGRARRDKLSVLELRRLLPADVVVAVDDQHLHARFLFKLFEPCGKLTVPLILAVFSQVAGDKHVFEPLRFCHFAIFVQSVFQNGVRKIGRGGIELGRLNKGIDIRAHERLWEIVQVVHHADGQISLGCRCLQRDARQNADEQCK